MDLCKVVKVPAGIWCENDVVLTSMRRDYVASTLIRRHFDTKCPLGVFARLISTFGSYTVYPFSNQLYSTRCIVIISKPQSPRLNLSIEAQPIPSIAKFNKISFFRLTTSDGI